MRAKGIVEGFWRLYTDDFNEIKIPVPPEGEQVSISAWLRSTGDRVKHLRASANRLIGLVREYRTRLIADVVTGKLDVREAAADLPDAEPVTTGNRRGINHPESHSDATEHEMAKEAIT